MTDVERVLTVLTNAHGGWVQDLYRATGCMVHSRVAELRRRGHLIECKRFGHRDYRYRLVTGAADALRGLDMSRPRGTAYASEA